MNLCVSLERDTSQNVRTVLNLIKSVPCDQKWNYTLENVALCEDTLVIKIVSRMAVSLVSRLNISQQHSSLLYSLQDENSSCYEQTTRRSLFNK